MYSLGLAGVVLPKGTTESQVSNYQSKGYIGQNVNIAYPESMNTPPRKLKPEYKSKSKKKRRPVAAARRLQMRPSKESSESEEVVEEEQEEEVAEEQPEEEEVEEAQEDEQQKDEQEEEPEEEQSTTRSGRVVRKRKAYTGTVPMDGEPVRKKKKK